MNAARPPGHSRWFNRPHNRSGTLWEERYKNVIVESGIAARTMAAYIDLNPVRAGNGSKAFVNGAFIAARQGFTPGRKDGARRMRGNGKAAAGMLWSLRVLRLRV